MAVDIPLLRERRILGFKTETTTGSGESITATEATVNVYDPVIEPEIGFNERKGQGALSAQPGRTGPHGARVRFLTELVGKGASGVPAWGDLLLAAGFELASTTYNVSTDNANAATLTCGIYEDGWFFSATGVKLNLRMRGEIGKPVSCEWSGIGKWVAPSAVALIEPTYATTIAPVLESATFTIGGTAYRISNFELDLGNRLTHRQDITDGTGYHAAAITGRRPTFTIDPERVAAGTKNWFTTLTAHTEAALSLVIGATQYNIMTIAAPKLQVISATGGDRDGIQIDQLQFQANRSAAAGDDELTIAFT